MSPKHEPRALDALAVFLAELGPADIPEVVLARAGDCILDALGATVAGRQARATRAMAEAMEAEMPDGPARLWFDGRSASPVAAATVNAMAATALDIDDGHRQAAGHPGAAAISAAFAMAEARDASLTDTVIAVVAGYEAAVRVALARHPAHHTSTVSGRWSGIGAAAAAGRLAGLNAGQMAQALLIAEAHAPRVAAALPHGFAGSDAKEGIAWSVHAGMMAVRLAQAGFRGYPDTFDQDVLYDPARLIEGLGEIRTLEGLFFKPYACCRWIHSALDALAFLLAETDIAVDGIERIEVETFERAATLGNSAEPVDVAEAQFSIPFCLATIAVEGPGALLPLRPELIGDGRVTALARRVSVVVASDMQAMFPRLAPARLRLHAGGRVHTHTVEAAFGDPTNPMRRFDLQEKFRILAAPHVSALRLEAILDRFAIGPGPIVGSARSALDPVAAPVRAGQTSATTA